MLEHTRLRSLLDEVEAAAQVLADSGGAGGWREVRRTFGAFACELVEHMTREELTPELAPMARLHVEHEQQRLQLRAALDDLATEARPNADMAEEITWLTTALRRDMEEEERALLTASAAPAAGAAATLCRDVMRRPVRTIRESDTACAAARVMLEANIGFLVVCDAERRPIGALTDRDLAIRLVAERQGPDVDVGSLMTHGVVTCHPADPVALAERLMAKHQKARIVCVDGNGEAVGVITLGDLSQREGADARSAHVLRHVARREIRRA